MTFLSRFVQACLMESVEAVITTVAGKGHLDMSIFYLLTGHRTDII